MINQGFECLVNSSKVDLFKTFRRHYTSEAWRINPKQNRMRTRHVLYPRSVILPVELSAKLYIGYRGYPYGSEPRDRSRRALHNLFATLQAFTYAFLSICPLSQRCSSEEMYHRLIVSMSLGTLILLRDKLNILSLGQVTEYEYTARTRWTRNFVYLQVGSFHILPPTIG